ncbi:ABC transporter substrate-binding protein [Actinospica durhamensis]|uniref:ABC transporter substrate-binding protein n=1 Tax=Actinospica durhamensis TaxID=1508375 RepID=A0A941EPC9_9ACTN|nr:ABC transporter substrate-binding protein [Actinospica durhamensis]MBR7834805.1 ABC transporter substrate-binding protein [Actinospica durhamensis]
MTGSFELTRRHILRTAGLGALAAGAAGSLADCSSSLKGSGGSNSGTTLRIGYVSPQTGSLSSFAQSDQFVLKRLAPVLAKGFSKGGKTYTVEIVVEDSQSTTTQASAVTTKLITQDQVNLVVASATPDTANPVSSVCEANGVPNVTTIVPWEAWFFGRGKTHGQSFQWSTCFFVGVDQLYQCFESMWHKLGVERGKVDCLWPNDTDANAFRSAFPGYMKADGYTAVDSGAYQDGLTDFSPEIATFKGSAAELFTCTPIPPDFQTFWKQAAQQGYKPKLATVAKVMLFPAEAVALGTLSNNIATDVWWSPQNPYTSTLDGVSASALATAYSQSTGNQWSQALGSCYSLFEIALQAFKNASDPTDKAEIAAQLKSMKITGISGPLDFTSGPEHGVALQKLCGGQWKPGTTFPWDMYIVDNSLNPAVPTNGTLAWTNP